MAPSSLKLRRGRLPVESRKAKKNTLFLLVRIHIGFVTSHQSSLSVGGWLRRAKFAEPEGPDKRSLVPRAGLEPARTKSEGF